jgi:hypothetical protein
LGSSFVDLAPERSTGLGVVLRQPCSRGFPSQRSPVVLAFDWLSQEVGRPCVRLGFRSREVFLRSLPWRRAFRLGVFFRSPCSGAIHSDLGSSFVDLASEWSSEQRDSSSFVDASLRRSFLGLDRLALVELGAWSSFVDLASGKGSSCWARLSLSLNQEGSLFSQTFVRLSRGLEKFLRGGLLLLLVGEAIALGHC